MEGSATTVQTSLKSEPLATLHSKIIPGTVASEVNPAPAGGLVANPKKCQATQLGIIYEEISLIDSVDDVVYGLLLYLHSDLIPSLFDTPLAPLTNNGAISIAALKLKAKPETKGRAESRIRLHLRRREEAET